MLSSEVRKQKLDELQREPEPATGRNQHKLYYRGRNQSFPVYTIDLDLLIYNRHNGRLEDEMLTWQREHSASSDVYDDDLHKLIEDLLWKSNVGRNQQTLEDLKQKQQQKPGIVTADGVVIDGNRRAMLLRRIEREPNPKQYFEAIILPDTYEQNAKEIVRLETQYQLGEDAKLEYGPLQKYLKAKRLRRHYDILEEEIGQLMGETKQEIERLLGIMQLMDDYLDHIDCPGLYTMLKNRDGTKEGMFVDLFNDLNRLRNPSGRTAPTWAYDELEIERLRVIQFDHIRFGANFSDTNKKYREISHGGNNKNFFAHRDLWEPFRDAHEAEISPLRAEMGTLTDYQQANPDHATLVDAARARDEEWKNRVDASVKRNFGRTSDRLETLVGEFEPRRLLERAKAALDRIDVGTLTNDPENVELVMQINRRTYEMKRRLERA